MEPTTVTMWATAATGAATVVLAIATLIYVRKTDEAVAAAKDGAESARASALHASRAIDATERATLAQAMPLLILRWSTTVTVGQNPSMDFTVHNVGKSTAVNGSLYYDEHDHNLPPLPPGREERAVRGMRAEFEDGRPRPVTNSVTVYYEDAIGNQIKTECALMVDPGEPMYQTSLKMANGRYEPLKSF